MMRFCSTVLALILASALSGCLLPQPDTPIIPPVPQAAGRSTGPVAAPAQPPAPGQEAQPTVMPDPGQGLTKDTALAPVAPGTTEGPAGTAEAPGQLEGTIRGRKALRVTAVPVTEGVKVVSEVTAEGRFALALAPGAYWLDLELEGETGPLRVDTRIQIESGLTRVLTLTLSKDPPKATVSEEAPLVTPVP